MLVAFLNQRSYTGGAFEFSSLFYVNLISQKFSVNIFEIQKKKSEKNEAIM